LARACTSQYIHGGGGGGVGGEGEGEEQAEEEKEEEEVCWFVLFMIIGL
jgi:hypothetical protein